ncbi:MAG: hypothetical protein R3C16_09220 [Hyphomonadaceae bacterium]
MGLAWTICALALLAGALLGARALLKPHWAARFVRLTPDHQGGGFAEFRATYGGVFLGAHAAALLFTLVWLYTEEYSLGVLATGASAVLAAAWVGSAFGRGLSMLSDNTRTRFNTYSAVVEVVLGLAIGAPWLVWLLG